jgi:hypothetical protein
MKVVVMNISDLTTYKTIDHVEAIYDAENGFMLHYDNGKERGRWFVEGNKFVLEVQSGECKEKQGMNDRDKKVIEWFISGDSGVSSETLCACLFGILPKKKYKRHPGDPGDFGRCKRFLDLLSSEDKETVFREAAKLSREWKALIENWDCLEKMYNEHDQNLFDQMQRQKLKRKLSPRGISAYQKEMGQVSAELFPFHWLLCRKP